MGLVSGHGEETIVGKDGLDECTQRLVLWSWSEQEFNAYYEAVRMAKPSRCMRKPLAHAEVPFVTGSRPRWTRLRWTGTWSN